MIEKDVRDVTQSEEGATMIEYALLAALIAVIAIVAIRFLGEAVSTQFSTVGSAIAD